MAKTKGTTVGDIMRANPGQIGNRNLIYPGQKLIISVISKEISVNKPTQHQPKIEQKSVPNVNIQNRPVKVNPAIKHQTPVLNPKVPTQTTNSQPILKGSLKLGANEDYRSALLLAQKRTGIDASALASLINAEAAVKNGKWAADSFNQKTNAMGLTQFLPKTWGDAAITRGTLLNEIAVQKGCVRHEGSKFIVVNESALLNLRKDPTLSIVSAAEYAKGNVSSLERSGFIPSNTGSDEKAKYMYFSHHEGLAGAKIHLSNPKNISEEKAKSVLSSVNKGKGNYSTYREAYADFAEKFARGKFSAQTDGKTVNSYVQKYGDYAQGYRAWLNDYTNKKIQPDDYRTAGSSVSPATVSFARQPKAENNPVNNRPAQSAASKTGLPDTSAMNESQKYDVYAGYFNQKGVKLDAAPEQRSILGLRVTTNSTANGNKGAYDDRMVVLWTDKNGQKKVREFLTANTEPNYRYVAEGKAERDVNRDGKPELAKINDGAYEFYKSSWKYGNALREKDNIMPALYDTNHDGNYDSRDTKANAAGILFHQGKSSDVGSMGCQTLPPGKFSDFWNSLGSDNRFTYLLVTVK